MDHESVHERLRDAAAELDDRPVAVAGRGARDLLGKLDELETQLLRLQRGLEATADRLAARPDGSAR